MGYFDGMENQKELEIYFKKLVSAFISLTEDLEENEDREYPTIIMDPANPMVAGNNIP